MTAPFRLTPRAYEDVRNIGRYTQTKWGKAQRDTYLRALDARFHWLAANPMRGRHRPEVDSGYYSFPQGGHVIFYLIDAQGISIIGIPHQAMDIASYFDSDTPTDN